MKDYDWIFIQLLPSVGFILALAGALIGIKRRDKLAIFLLLYLID